MTIIYHGIASEPITFDALLQLRGWGLVIDVWGRRELDYAYYQLGRTTASPRLRFDSRGLWLGRDGDDGDGNGTSLTDIKTMAQLREYMKQLAA